MPNYCCLTLSVYHALVAFVMLPEKSATPVLTHRLLPPHPKSSSMYPYLIIALMLLPCTGVRAQNAFLADTTGQCMIPMSATTVDHPNGNRYYERGASQPYTGILYGKYANGAFLTMQQDVDGIGNGFWIDFDPDGKVAVRGTYTDNRLEGPVTK